jgi:hypothetical protein
MSLAQASQTFAVQGGLSTGFQRLLDEVALLAGALFSPVSFIDQGEQQRALYLQALSLDASAPERAAALRRRAARIGR